MTDLVLFTAQYPYGVVGETFLESEVPVLARRFRRVVVLPHSVVAGRRSTPANVEVLVMPWVNGPSRVTRFSALASREAAVVLRSTFGLGGDRIRDARAARLGVDILTRNIDKYRQLVTWIPAQGLADAVFYDYWFENSTVALALLRRFGHVRSAIARAHNFDVFDDEADGLTVPFRRFKALELDAVAPTSIAAARHLAARVPAARDKLHVHPLGVPDPGVVRVSDATPGAARLIVTCSSFAPYKRMAMVPEVFSHLDVPFRWVHIGDGPGRAEVEDLAERLLPQGTFEFLGQLRNNQVIDFYRSTPVAALLSVSSCEGLPVSMMEAQSYGIPIVATDVGGVREIVRPETGVLVSESAEPRQVARALQTATAPGTFDPCLIREHWLHRFEADSNYEQFADFLLTIHQR